MEREQRPPAHRDRDEIAIANVDPPAQQTKFSDGVAPPISGSSKVGVAPTASELGFLMGEWPLRMAGSPAAEAELNGANAYLNEKHAAAIQGLKIRITLDDSSGEERYVLQVLTGPQQALNRGLIPFSKSPDLAAQLQAKIDKELPGFLDNARMEMRQ